jgi:hypothetical protein
MHGDLNATVIEDKLQQASFNGRAGAILALEAHRDACTMVWQTSALWACCSSCALIRI